MKRATQKHPEPGVFRPAPPDDTGDVLKLYAVAARVACAVPDNLPQIEAALAEAVGPLEPPESLTAQECERLWQAFRRTVLTLQHAKWELAGKALVGDLDALGQRLDAMPLTSWEKLPTAHEDPRARSHVAEVVSGQGATVAIIRQRAKEELSSPGLTPLSRAREVQNMLLALPVPARAQAITQMIDQAALSRGDGVMVTRLLAKGAQIEDEDEALIEVLERVGKWLASGEA